MKFVFFFQPGEKKVKDRFFFFNYFFCVYPSIGEYGKEGKTELDLKIQKIRGSRHKLEYMTTYKEANIL